MVSNAVMMRHLMCALIVAVLACPASAKARPLETTLCEIARNPAKFHNKTVRVQTLVGQGTEALGLIEPGQRECGVINLDLHTLDESKESQRFVQLLREHVETRTTEPNRAVIGAILGLESWETANKNSSPSCGGICAWCPRYELAGVFVGKIRYAKREKGQVGYGHMNGFDIQMT